MNKVNKTRVSFPLHVFETFAGIGAQHKALTNIDKSGKYFKVTKTSEWDARAIISYSQIHNKNKFDKKLLEVKKWSDTEIDGFLSDKTISLDSKKPCQITRKKRDFKENLIAAMISNNNLPDIKKVKGYDLKNIDLLTYSFPCQGLSIANMGRGKGIKRNADSTSNLIWEINRILLETDKNQLPKYLLMENVKNLISEKHIKDYQKWLAFLKKLGYNTKTVVLNALNYGSTQKRERVFAISILNWDNKQSDAEFYEWFLKRYRRKLSDIKRKKTYLEILKSSNQHLDEIKKAIPNKTPSRIRMAKENHDLHERKWAKGKEWTFNTLTTKQDRHPNIGMIKIPKGTRIKGKLAKRFITHREAYMIMGFGFEDFENVKPKFLEGVLNGESLYKQAGNSIAVQVLQAIFKFIKDFERGVYE